MRQWTNLTTFILFCCMIVLSASVYADKKQWELGVGIAALDIPLYPGSSQSKTYIFPVPYVVYRSEKLEINNGVDLTLFKKPGIRFNVSADLGVPVNSSDSEARAGMPDLDLVIQFGPSLEITLAGGRFKPSHLRLDLPVRVAIATDFGSAESVGWIFEPRLSYESRRPYKTGFANLISAGLRFSTEELHGYYYDVEPAFVTPTRPEFKTQGGYSGLFIDYIANWRSEDFILWALLRYQNLEGAAFEDSPLVEQKDYLMFGAGLTWVFARNL